MSIERVIWRVSAAFSLGFCLTSTPALADEVAVFGTRDPGLELGAYTDEPGGSKIGDGRYAEAISDIESHLPSMDSIERVVAYNNLCVAKTVLRELEAAAHACDAAVKRAASYDRRFRYRERSASMKALSNRGVMHVLLGNIEAAIVDLERADSLDRYGWMAPAQNLAYIGGLSDQSFAGAD